MYHATTCITETTREKVCEQWVEPAWHARNRNHSPTTTTVPRSRLSLKTNTMHIEIAETIAKILLTAFGKSHQPNVVGSRFEFVNFLHVFGVTRRHNETAWFTNVKPLSIAGEHILKLWLKSFLNYFKSHIYGRQVRGTVLFGRHDVTNGSKSTGTEYKTLTARLQILSLRVQRYARRKFPKGLRFKTCGEGCLTIHSTHLAFVDDC